MSDADIPAPSSARPLDLPRLLMRRAGMVAAGVLVLALLLGLWSVSADTDEEVDAGLQLARVMAIVGQAAQQDDARLMQALKSQLSQGRLRHVALELRDARGLLLLTHGPVGAPRLWPWQAEPELRAVAWALPRPDGRAWQIRLRASREGERSEALANLGGMLALLLLCVAGLLVSMRWNLRHALQPLSQLLSAMAGIGRGDLQPLRVLPPMPVTELQTVAAALRQLAQALDDAQAQRRELSRKMLTLQEEERRRIAHELHDELGQRLTAMRVNAAHLLRGLDAQASVRPGVLQLKAHCEQLQQDVRQLLAGLQPFDEPGGTTGPVSLERLVSQLGSLVDGWNRDSAAGLQVHLKLQATDAAGRARPWPVGLEAQSRHLPLALAQALYRISQECLTNVARHAAASQAQVQLTLREPEGDGAACIEWQVSDNGRGIDDVPLALRRGNGLAGIHQRVWAAGGDLSIVAAQAQAQPPGLILAASFSLPPQTPDVTLEQGFPQGTVG